MEIKKNEQELREEIVTIRLPYSSHIEADIGYGDKIFS